MTPILSATQWGPPTASKGLFSVFVGVVVGLACHARACLTMLSAIAARKAAKAAMQAPFSKPSSPSPPSDSPSPPPTGTSKSVGEVTSKRKPRVSANAGPPRSKKAKVAHAPGPTKLCRRARYFDPGDMPDARNQTIDAVDDSRMEGSSESDSSSGEEMAMAMAMDIPPPVVLPPSISVVKTKRTWSPSRPVPDSSGDDEPEPTSYSTPSISKHEPVALSTFFPVPNDNVYPVPENEGKARILVLRPNETLALVGTYSFCVLQGSLSLLGVTLSPSDTKHTVYAPRSSPIPILSWAKSNHQSSCTLPIPQAIRQQTNVTVILIECVETGVEGLGRICKAFENVFKLPRELETVKGMDIPRIHLVNHSTKNAHPFVLPSSWEAALAAINEDPDSELSGAPICLVKGPKKCGKSTLARTLVNRLLSRYRRVAFLECDLGQSEFTPGGLVALNLIENYVFGPPFTHPSLPYLAHFIGASSPRSNPSHYLLSIQTLLEAYKLDLQFPVSMGDPPRGDERIYDTIPLVINTMGWNKGLGADLNTRIEEFAAASHTFEVDGAEGRGWPAPPPSQHVPQFLTTSPFMRTNVRRYSKVEAIHSEITNTHRTPTDYRHLNILSYFHALFPELPASSPPRRVLKQITATSWDTSLPLCARYPYEVDYTQAFDHVYLTGAGYEDVVQSELTRVLNGAIVGLVSVDSASAFSPSTSPDVPPLPYIPGEPPPDPAHSTCHGLALVRGLPLTFELHAPRMHVLTPLPTALLARGRVLVKGEMELPIWGMLDFREDDMGRVAGVDKAHVPYLQWGKGEGVGGEKRRVRRNLMRKGQM